MGLVRHEDDSGQERELSPLGVRPRWSWDEQRTEDLLQAMHRYAEAGKPANVEWVVELMDLVSEARARRYGGER